MSNLTYEEAKHIADLDGMYFIKNEDRWTGRHRNLIRRYPIFELSVNDGPNGKADRSGESGFRFTFPALHCTGDEVKMDIIESLDDGRKYLRIISDSKYSWVDPGTTIFYPIEDGIVIRGSGIVPIHLDSKAMDYLESITPNQLIPNFFIKNKKDENKKEVSP